MATRWGDYDRSFAYLDDFRRRMDRLFDEVESGATRAGAVGLLPQAQLWDAGASLTLTADVPGMGERDVKLTLNQDVLSIEGERRIDAPEGYSVHRRERAPVRFARSFTLPCRVDPERTTATVRDGVLTVTLPKAPEAQPRQIAVRGGA